MKWRIFMQKYAKFSLQHGAPIQQWRRQEWSGQPTGCVVIHCSGDTVNISSFKWVLLNVAIQLQRLFVLIFFHFLAGFCDIAAFFPFITLVEVCLYSHVNSVHYKEKQSPSYTQLRNGTTFSQKAVPQKPELIPMFHSMKWLRPSQSFTAYCYSSPSAHVPTHCERSSVRAHHINPIQGADEVLLLNKFCTGMLLPEVHIHTRLYDQKGIPFIYATLLICLQ